MKKLNKQRFCTFTAFALALVLTTACSDDLLEQSNQNATSSANFGTSADQVTKAVNAAYHPLTTPFLYGRVIMAAGFLRSDEYYIKDLNEVTRPAGLAGSPGARWATEIWQQNYQTIGRCNTIISGTNEEGIPDAEVRNGLVGQAYFLRAFCYWHLVQYFGNVPLTLDEPDLNNVLLEQSTPEQILPQVIADFQKAEELLPERWTGDDVGRATSGSATAFLGKTHLFMENWAEAETSFRKVVDSGVYSLLPSERFEENFTDTNENNEESVFEFQFEAVATFLWGQNIPGTGTQGHFVIEFAPNTVSPDEGLYAHPYIKDLYETNGDEIRRNASMVYDFPGATGYAGQPFLSDFAPDIAVAGQDGVEPLFVKKYARFNLTRAAAAADNLGAANGVNWRVIRYSDVLLMLAEALNEQNNTGEAEGLVNQVRTRAQIATLSGLSQADMRNAIIDERSMELYSEGHRYLDLVRWGLAETFLGQNSAHPGPHPKFLIPGGDSFFRPGQDELLWIPLSELSSNANLKQNPGY